MHRDIQRVLISQYQIMARVREMAEKITNDFTEHDITIVPVMTGAMIFCGDLIRQIPIHMAHRITGGQQLSGRKPFDKGLANRQPAAGRRTRPARVVDR